MKYAIWLGDGFLELQSDGIIKITNDAFSAKLMPTKEHAFQLLMALFGSTKDWPWHYAYIVGVEWKIISISSSLPLATMQPLERVIT